MIRWWGNRYDKKFLIENVTIYKLIGLDIPLYGGRRCVRWKFEFLQPSLWIFGQVPHTIHIGFYKAGRGSSISYMGKDYWNMLIIYQQYDRMVGKSSWYCGHIIKVFYKYCKAMPQDCKSIMEKYIKIL